ncbi:MAG: cytochrome-c oxidase [Terriglobia bacterium]
MNIGIRLIQVAAVYMTVGVIMGLAMGIAGDFALSSVHAHVSLLGWATMGIAGIVYLLLPGCGQSPLAKLHFWGHNIGLPVMLVSLALYALGVAAAEKVIAAGSILVVASLLVFSFNVLRNGRLDYRR